MINTKIISQLPFDFITVNDVKVQCRLPDLFTQDDDYLRQLINATCSVCQRESYLLFTQSEVAASYHGEPLQSVVVPWGNVTDLTIAGVPESSYYFDEVSSRLYLPDLPSFNLSYKAGFTDENRDPVIKQAVLMMVATMYTNREDSITGLSVSSMPMTTRTLLRSVGYYAV